MFFFKHKILRFGMSTQITYKRKKIISRKGNTFKEEIRKKISQSENILLYFELNITFNIRNKSSLVCLEMKH